MQIRWWSGGEEWLRRRLAQLDVAALGVGVGVGRVGQRVRVQPERLSAEHGVARRRHGAPAPTPAPAPAPVQPAPVQPAPVQPAPAPAPAADESPDEPDEPDESADESPAADESPDEPVASAARRSRDSQTQDLVAGRYGSLQDSAPASGGPASFRHGLCRHGPSVALRLGFRSVSSYQFDSFRILFNSLSFFIIYLDWKCVKM